MVWLLIWSALVVFIAVVDISVARRRYLRHNGWFADSYLDSAAEEVALVIGWFGIWLSNIGAYIKSIPTSLCGQPIIAATWVCRDYCLFKGLDWNYDADIPDAQVFLILEVS